MTNVRHRAKRNIKEEVYSLTSSVPPHMSLKQTFRTWKWNKLVEQGGVLTTSVTVPTFASINFTVGALPEVSSFSALFDQYRITRVECWLTPIPATTGLISFQNWASVVDLDDSTNLGSFAAALDYDSCLVSPISMAHYRSFKPGVALSAYAGGFGSYAHEISPWIDMASTGVNHYGIKLASNITAVAVVDLTYRLHVEFRSNR